MKWRVHPARENIIKTVLSAGFIIIFVALIAIFYNLYWALLALLFLVASLHSYYFPTTYEITNEELIIKNIFSVQKRKFIEFKKFYIGKNGILLSPFHHKTFLNNFRGVFLLLPPKNDEIINFIKERFNDKSQ